MMDFRRHRRFTPDDNRARRARGTPVVVNLRGLGTRCLNFTEYRFRPA